MIALDKRESNERNIMGRRALRKINPAVDLGRNFRTFDQLPRPWDAAALFGRTAPLEVEIGSGKGLFLRRAAAGRPEPAFLGIEVAPKYARFAAAGLARASLTNAVVVQGDALRLFAELLPDGSLAAVHVYFPDPWWKRRHRRRRVMCAPLLRDVHRTLLPGGALHFWTDVEEYFSTTCELLSKLALFVGPLPVAETPAADEMDYRTHFERRVRQAAQPVYRAEYRKR